VKLFNNKNRQLRELRHLDWIDLSLEVTTTDLLFFDLVDPGSEQREIGVGGATFAESTGNYGNGSCSALEVSKIVLRKGV
jgi:hypothetical protein